MDHKTQSEVSQKAGNLSDADYAAFLDRFKVTLPSHPVFTTDADPEKLWEAYLSGFDESQRQHHNCRTCRKFIEQFGGLVTISSIGIQHSAVWGTDAITVGCLDYATPFEAMRRLVAKAKVTGVFLTDREVLGNPQTGNWRHLSLAVDVARRWSDGVLSSDQAMAEKLQEYQQVRRALEEWPFARIQQAVTILRSGALVRSEKVLAQAEWLKARAEEFSLTGSNKRNLLWLAISTAPAGFCHPRGGMLGTLIDQLESGRPAELIARAWSEKMDPLQYQRPQAAPAAQTIAQAEALVEKLGIARSLERRFCRVDEVVAVWRTKPVDRPKAGGVFGHLKPVDVVGVAGGFHQSMSWVKFAREILPTAESMEFWTPLHHLPWAALVTAVHADAPPILQWDVEGARNPVSWYVWNGGSKAPDFRLKTGEWVEVQAVCDSPAHWNPEIKATNHARTALLILRGAQERRMHGNALFPEILKSELHPVRSVIEAYSKAATIAGVESPHAAGPMIPQGFSVAIQLKVASGGTSITYTLDRWE